MTWTGVLHTSAVIALPRLSSTAGVPERPVTTTVTFAELAVGPRVADALQERARRQAVLQQAEADLEALPFDLGAARAFGRVAADLRKALVERIWARLVTADGRLLERVPHLACVQAVGDAARG